MVSGFFWKKSEVKLTSLAILVFSAIASGFAFYTGGGAEDVVKNISGISETYIHMHEEYAVSFLVGTLILGILSLVGFFAELKKHKYARSLLALVLFVAIIDGVLAKRVGTSGLEIRHSEIGHHLQVIDLGK